MTFRISKSTAGFSTLLRHVRRGYAFAVHFSPADMLFYSAALSYISIGAAVSVPSATRARPGRRCFGFGAGPSR